MKRRWLDSCGNGGQVRPSRRSRCGSPHAPRKASHRSEMERSCSNRRKYWNISLTSIPHPIKVLIENDSHYQEVKGEPHEKSIVLYHIDGLHALGCVQQRRNKNGFVKGGVIDIYI